MSNSIDRLLKNYINARKSWEMWCFMSGFNKNLKREFREVKLKVDNSPLLYNLRFLAMKDYHIELYKVLKNSKNNGDNIFLLLQNRIKSNPKNKAELEIALQELNEENSIITSTCDIRDKFYAHLDKNYEKILLKKAMSLKSKTCFTL